MQHMSIKICSLRIIPFIRNDERDFFLMTINRSVLRYIIVCSGQIVSDR